MFGLFKKKVKEQELPISKEKLAKLLHYSFSGVAYKWGGLTPHERAVVDRNDMKALETFVYDNLDYSYLNSNGEHPDYDFIEKEQQKAKAIEELIEYVESDCAGGWDEDMIAKEGYQRLIDIIKS